MAYIRVCLGLSVSQFAEIIGYPHPEMLKKIEAGSRKMPVDVAESICRVTSVPVEILTGEDAFDPSEVAQMIEVPWKTGEEFAYTYQIWTAVSELAAAALHAEANGLNMNIVLSAVRRETRAVLRRWNLDTDQVAKDTDEIKNELERSHFLEVLHQTRAAERAEAALEALAKDVKSKEHPAGVLFHPLLRGEAIKRLQGRKLRHRATK